MIRTKIVAVPKGSATYGLNPYKSNNGSSSISPSTGSGSSSSGGDSTKDCLWQTGDGDSSIISKGSDDLTSNMLEVAIGQYNKTTKNKTSFSVGNGTSTTDRSNAFEVQNDGTALAYTFKSDIVNTKTINSSTINNSYNMVNGGNITNTGDINSNGNFTNGGDINSNGNFTNGGDITNDGNITNTGTLKTSYATVDNDLTVGKTITAKTINADVGNIKDIYSDNITNKKMIKTKDLTVTGTAHFFELVIDKIKAAGGAALFTPADGFDIDVVEAVENGYKLYWRCEADGKVRQNMWKVNDQAICMSFNQAKVGVSHNVSNKYYWSLVTAVSEYDKPVIREDGNKYNWITISTVTFDGTVNPEVGDSIAMLGYRGTDDEKRQSAIYISAYASFDKGVDAPFIAQYKCIKDFDIEKYRTSWWSLKTNKFVGDFVIESSGKNVVDFINEQIKASDGKVDSSVTELNTIINEKYSSLSATIDGINTKVVNNTTSITKLSENLNDTNKNLEETNKNLDTTNGNITKLENTVKENYSTLDQKADSIDAKVVANTTKITKLGTNLETTNSNITELETSVNEKYAELNVKADGISSKVSDNTTKITKLGTNLETTNSNITELETSVNEKYAELNVKADGISSKVSDNTTKITKLGTNLETTNSNITELETSVNEKYAELNVKADGISSKVSDNTTKITKLGTNLETTNSNITELETFVNEKYAELNVNSGGLLSKVDENTKKITALGNNLETTNANITKLETTVSNNYSTLNQKADGISTKVASNTTKITKLGENLDTTNENVTSLKKTVTENYSTLDQKADSISSTVSSHTTTIEGLDGKVTTNTENISKIKQTADSINSTVQSINGDYVSKSLLQQTSNSILASVNDTYIKIGDDNITLGGNTTVKGNLTLTQTDQGFNLVGQDGVTEIMPKSVGTYNEFKASNSSKQNVVKSVNCRGSQSTSDGILRFEGGIIIYLGDRKKGDFIKVRLNTFESKVTNGWTGSSFTNSFDISTSFSAKVMNQYNSAVLHNWNTVYAGSEYSYTFDSNTPNARIYVTFKGNTQYSTWVGNYNVTQSGKPMPMPNAYIQLTGTVTLPTTAHMLIGYDGWGVNFGNNKTVYCGKDGFIASFGNNEFRITSEGISHNNMATTHTIIGSSSSSSPTIYEVQDPVDFVLCKSGNCKIRMPKTPYNGQTIKVLDKSSNETWIDFNGNYVCPCDAKYESRSLNSNWACKGMAPRLFTYLDNTWYEEYMG